MIDIINKLFSIENIFNKLKGIISNAHVSLEIRVKDLMSWQPTRSAQYLLLKKTLRLSH